MIDARRFIGGALLVLLVSACASTPSGEDGPVPEKSVVELDIFSGRPNPTWTLPDAEKTAFREKVDSLAGTASGQVANNLGYRGFIVRTGDEVVTVQRGLVRREQGGTTSYAPDPDRDLERWLLDSGRSSLEPDLVTTVEQELGG